ncbi:YggS family pyridoxal phosphate-dependent enzyme [bacterium]|nr:MAG: YggS family pyridoxal phosphate-dependent enzyme [bacterium]
MMIKENISRIKERISLVCSKNKLRAESITIVAVAKGRTPEQIQSALQSGIVDIGENRVQEAFLKYSDLIPKTYGLTPIKWHMVGHLQTNKVKAAVEMFDLIHSVDSLGLAKSIDRQSAQINKIQDILLQVNISGEASKSGFSKQEIEEAASEIAGLKNIKVKGLMTIAPIVVDPQEARPYFRSLRELRDKINALQITHNTLHFLSMGMSDDFEVAIEEGSNMLRLGRLIFGD